MIHRYISDAATYSPESCVFGQLINIGCVLLGIVVYIRYRQIEQLIIHHPSLMETSAKMNNTAMWLGIGSCLGCSIVANFQETNIRIMHYIGALNCFGLGTAYFWMQAYLTYNIHPYVGSLRLAHARLGLAVLCTIFFTVVAVTGVISHILFNVSTIYLVNTIWYICKRTFDDSMKKIIVMARILIIN